MLYQKYSCSKSVDTNFWCRRTQYSWSVDVEKTKRDLGWEPVYPSVKVAIQKQLAAMNIEIK